MTNDVENFFKRKLPRQTNELVLIEESLAANGIGRLIMDQSLSLTTSVPLFYIQLENQKALNSVTLNYSEDLAGWLSKEPLDLLQRIENDVKAAVNSTPSVLVIDSLSPLLQTYALHSVLRLLHTLQKLPNTIGLVARYNASLYENQISQALRAQATTYLLVETHASIAAYHFLSKESKRFIPTSMHGMILMIRKSKSGKLTEAITYFNESLQFVASTDIQFDKKPNEPPAQDQLVAALSSDVNSPSSR
ncbi:hypothetical protein THRCLA_07753 [Thraustotheca clavata]|uniref:Elongator complex protein 5 n=1 Tax=Thraustotheca clavata TaxID=74557 RepID=A0A1V9ZCD3_9STRA|nr:hypothetical protein THRCLA_07753 [Thraustotheca clavata]